MIEGEKEMGEINSNSYSTGGDPAEPSPACLVCNRPLESWACCDGCVARTDRHLADIGLLQRLATHALHPGTTGGGRSAERGLGVRVTALDLALASDAIRELEAWERDWRNHLGLAAYGLATSLRNTSTDPGHVLAGIIRFLRAQWPEAAQRHPAADEFAQDVRRLRAAHIAVLGDPNAPALVIACPADEGEDRCGRALRIEREQGEVDCRGCGSHWTTRRLLLVALADSAADVWVDAEACAHALGVSVRTVQRWARSGQIRRRGSMVQVPRDFSRVDA